MGVDRGEKLRFYERLPMLADIVLLYQDQIRAERCQWVDTGWRTAALTRPDDVLIIAALGCSVCLADAYDRSQSGP